jgi:predicted metal-binding membrane protein
MAKIQSRSTNMLAYLSGNCCFYTSALMFGCGVFNKFWILWLISFKIAQKYNSQT